VGEIAVGGSESGTTFFVFWSVIASLVVREWACFDSREALNPVAEIAREDKRAPTPFNRTKFAGIDRLIERCPASARDRARLCYAVRKR
jgi:hypothetical protein